MERPRDLVSIVREQGSVQNQRDVTSVLSEGQCGPGSLCTDGAH